MNTLKNARGQGHQIHPMARGMLTDQEEYILMRMEGVPKPKREPKPVTLRHFSWEN